MVAMLTPSQQQSMQQQSMRNMFFGLGGNTSPFEAGADSLARQRQMQQNQGRQRMLGGGGGLRDIFRGGIFGGQRPTDQGPLGGIRNQMRQQFERTQGPETTRFVEMGGQEFRLTNPIPVPQRSQQGGPTRSPQGPETNGYSPFPPQGGFNRGINPGGMYTGGRGGGFGSPFGGSMRGGRQQPPAC